MLIASLIIGAALLVGGSLLVSFWNNVIGWLKRAIAKVQQVINKAVYGMKLFIRQLSNGFRETSKHYSKDDNNRWNETVTTREVSANEVPPEIRKMAAHNKDRDITNELALKLQG
jgi:hypothetical protein